MTVNHDQDVQASDRRDVLRTMPAVIRLKSGKEFTVDRSVRLNQVYEIIEDAQHPRPDGKPLSLVCLADNRTPSRQFYIDPNEVEAIYHDGYNY